MRPARKGPENRRPTRSRPLPADPLASMRPARKGPENPPFLHGGGVLVNGASMRPARKGPENRSAWLDRAAPKTALQ